MSLTQPYTTTNMNTSILSIDIEGDKIPELFKTFLKNRMTEGEVIYFAARQKAPKEYRRNIIRQQMKKSAIGILLSIGWFFIVPALPLSYISLWWLLLGLPGLLSMTLYFHVYRRYMKNMLEQFNGLFVITNKYARYISCGDIYFGGNLSDVANAVKNANMITGCEFEISPNLVTDYRENADGTAMIDFDRYQLTNGSIPAGQCAWQYVTSGKEARSVLETICKL